MNYKARILDEAGKELQTCCKGGREEFPVWTGYREYAGSASSGGGQSLSGSRIVVDICTLTSSTVGIVINSPNDASIIACSEYS